MLLSLAAALGCGPAHEVESAHVSPAPVAPAPLPAPRQAEPLKPLRAPLRFARPWSPQWRLETTSSERIHLGALEAGLLLYVDGGPDFDRTPHRLLDDRLVPVAGMGVVKAEKYDPQWLEFYGRYPDALWRVLLPPDDGAFTLGRWTGDTWRPIDPLPDECDLRLVGHSAGGGLILATAPCSREDGDRIHLYEFRLDERRRVGPALSHVPEFALATDESLYLAGSFDDESRQAIRRYPCAAPYDCAPEVFSSEGLPGVLTWLDHTWCRQWQGLAHPRGISIALQRTSPILEAYLLTHDAHGWRSTPAPGRITGLLALAEDRFVVTRAPVSDAELNNGDWPESKPVQGGDTLWLLGAEETDWQPVQLPTQAREARELEVATEDGRLWLGVRASSGAFLLFSAAR